MTGVPIHLCCCRIFWQNDQEFSALQGFSMAVDHLRPLSTLQGFSIAADHLRPLRCSHDHQASDFFSITKVQNSSQSRTESFSIILCRNWIYKYFQIALHVTEIYLSQIVQFALHYVPVMWKIIRFSIHQRYQVNQRTAKKHNLPHDIINCVICKQVVYIYWRHLKTKARKS